MKDGVLRWGICCAGKISNDFVNAVNSLPKTEHQVVSVAARNLEKCKEFAKKHSILKAYSSYDELASDPDIDIVYVGALIIDHYRLSKMMLEGGKHVLSEKPLCDTAANAKALFALAKSKNLFMMEGLWSRFFPAYAKARELIDSGVIGEVNHVNAQFGLFGLQQVPRMRQKELGGGSILDLCVYPVQFAQFVFGEKPLEQHSFGSLLETGVDAQCHTFLRYSNNRTAVVGSSMLANLPNEGKICGTKGVIRVCNPLWCPTKVELTLNYENAVYDKMETFEFPLPTKFDNEFVFLNGAGFTYEATAVRNCIVKGLTECSVATPTMSIQISEILYNARKQLGYDLPNDDKVPQ